MSAIKTSGGNTGSITFSPYTPTLAALSRLLAPIELPLSSVYTGCTEEQSLLEIVRTCGVNGSEESFEIYFGVEPSSSTEVFSQSTCIAGTFYICISPVEYTLVMRDTGLDGWSSGSHLILKSGKVSLDYAMESGSVIAHKVFNFGAPVVDQSSSNTLTSEDPIQVSLIRSCGNSSDSEGFAIYEGATRDRAIYSQTQCVAGVVNLLLSRGLHTIVMKEANGQAWEENSMIRVFSGGLIGSYRKAVAGGEESKHFECSVELAASEQQSLVGSGVAQSNKVGMTGYSVENLFDDSISTNFRVAVTSSEFPVEVTYTFPEGDAYTMNKYMLTNGDSVAAACNTWKIFGKANEESEWVMLDSQDSVAWSEAYQSLSFTVENASAFHAYMFQCSAVVDIDDEHHGNQMDMAEWKLIQYYN